MSKETEQAVIVGGVPLDVELQDGSREAVTVRLLKIREFPDYLRVVDDEGPLAEFLCGKPAGWAETLTISSLLDICDKGHEVNFKNACRWGERRARTNEALLPIVASGQAIQSAFPNSAPTSASVSAEAPQKSPQA